MATNAVYREWRPAARLSGDVACLWAGRLADDGTPYVPTVLPDGCVDLVWDGAKLVVAGPDTGPVEVTARPAGLFAGLRFRPGRAPAYLGVPAAALRDRRVDAADVLGPRAEPLVERLADARSLPAAAVLLQQEILGRLSAAAPADPLIEAAETALGTAGPAVTVTRLASDLGVTERTLHRRCTAAVGYGPKTLHRVLRFRRFLRAAADHPEAGLATLAALVGYADQAHLARDCRALAAASPGDLRASGRT